MTPVANSTIQRSMNSVYTSWGTSLTVTPNRNQSLVLINNWVIALVWIPSTADVNLLAISQYGVCQKQAQNTLSTSASETFVPLTITRSSGSSSFTISTTDSGSFTALI